MLLGKIYFYINNNNNNNNNNKLQRVLKSSAVETGYVEQQLPGEDICVSLNVSFFILQGPLLLRYEVSLLLHNAVPYKYAVSWRVITAAA